MSSLSGYKGLAHCPEQPPAWRDIQMGFKSPPSHPACLSSVAKASCQLLQRCLKVDGCCAPLTAPYTDALPLKSPVVVEWHGSGP